MPSKKAIPKLKKKLIGFLSDESGKITKEDVLKMGMIAMGLYGMVPVVDAAHGNVCVSHGSGYISFNEILSQGFAGYYSTQINGHVNGVQSVGSTTTNSQHGSGHGSHVSTHSDCGRGNW